MIGHCIKYTTVYGKAMNNYLKILCFIHFMDSRGYLRFNSFFYFKLKFDFYFLLSNLIFYLYTK